MRLGRLLIVLAVVVILVLVAVYLLLNLGGTPPEDAAGTIDIVIVVQPIPRGGIITADQLGYLAYPAGQTIEGMFTNTADVVGKRARYELQAGVPLTQSMVVETAAEVAETGSDTALLIPAGMVAFPIPIDRFSSLAYGLRAGDHVNVISTMLFVALDGSYQAVQPNNIAGVQSPGPVIISSGTDGSSTITIDALINILTAQVVPAAGSPQGRTETDPLLGTFYVIPSEPQRPRLVSQTLLQDIVILHVGNFLYTDQNGDEVQPPSTQIDAAGNAVPASVNPPDIITLIVSPQDAVTLNYLVYAGADLTLALRSVGDDSVISTNAVTLEYLLTTYNIPKPNELQPLPYGLEPRVDSLISPTQQDQLPQPAQ